MTLINNCNTRSLLPSKANLYSKTNSPVLWDFWKCIRGVLIITVNGNCRREFLGGGLMTHRHLYQLKSRALDNSLPNAQRSVMDTIHHCILQIFYERWHSPQQYIRSCPLLPSIIEKMKFPCKPHNCYVIARLVNFRGNLLNYTHRTFCCAKQ